MFRGTPLKPKKSDKGNGSRRIGKATDALIDAHVCNCDTPGSTMAQIQTMPRNIHAHRCSFFRETTEDSVANHLEKINRKYESYMNMKYQ
jgi:hypothetical protein